MTVEDLKTMQGWSLQRKIQVTQTRILEWLYNWNGRVYVSFSGGKDSTVLLDLARRVDPNIPAVFCDTGLEFPEVRDFALSVQNLEVIRPLKYDSESRKFIPTNFRDVIITHGYPVVSKEVSQSIQEARSPTAQSAKQKFDENSDYIKKYGERFSLTRWTPLKDSNIHIGAYCCKAMKKTPAKQYEKATGRKCMVATMACESRARKTQWYKSGCNSYEGRPMGKPMSFWTEQDVLEYLKITGLPYASVYGDIVTRTIKRRKQEVEILETTGLERTGCMFCMFGAHLEKEPNRFQKLKLLHPRQYEYCIGGGEFNNDGMRIPSKSGLGLGYVLDFLKIPY